MVQTQPEAASIGERHHFLIRRLHSLTGLVPVGVFLCIHLCANGSILLPGPPGAEFQKAIERIHLLGPLLTTVEIVGIFIPLLFHALLGFQILFTSDPNAQRYRYGPNIRYTLQRASGVIAFLFIAYHVWQMHWLGAGLGGGHFALHDNSGAATAAQTTAGAIQAAWWIAPVYAIGIIASVFHLANGIWTSLITWGITIKPPSQRAAGYVCAVFGVLLALVGLGALSGFRTFNAHSSTNTMTAHAITARSAP